AAFRVDIVADGIDDERAVARPDPGDAAPREKRTISGDAAPEIGAAVTEWTFLRMELVTHGGVDAVAGHQNIAPLRGQHPTVRADEMRGDASLVLLDRAAAMSNDEILRADARAHGIQQHLLQIAAVEREMRPLMAGRKPPWLAVDELAVAREEGVVLGRASGGDERVLQPERAQLLYRMRSQIDADP